MQLLFRNSNELNVIDLNGRVTYHPFVFSEEESNEFYKRLFAEIQWQQDVVKLFGKVYVTDRKVAWYAEKPFIYRYSGQSKIAFPLTESLINIKSKVEIITGSTYDACLLNLYHSGSEGMGWHSDNEKSIKQNSSIASVSLGTSRKFQFKHKNNGQKVDIILESGSVLDMREETQEFWLHSLPKSKIIKGARINLTFRKMTNSCEIYHH